MISQLLDNLFKIDSAICLISLIISVTIHEYSHSVMAYILGDDTSKQMGRMSINPLVHIDIFGTIILPLLSTLSSVNIIGYAKPVLVNANMFTKKLNIKHANAIVALAGPISNVVLSFIFLIITTLLIQFTTPNVAHRLQLYSIATNCTFEHIRLITNLSIQKALIVSLSGSLTVTNICLAIFNMIPIGPLDGAKVFGALMPNFIQNKYERFCSSQSWFLIIFVLIQIGLFRDIIYNIASSALAMLGFVAKLILQSS